MPPKREVGQSPTPSAEGETGRNYTSIPSQNVRDN
jgi:hypothetical protein